MTAPPCRPARREASGQARGAPVGRGCPCAPRAGPEASRESLGAASERARRVPSRRACGARGVPARSGADQPVGLREDAAVARRLLRSSEASGVTPPHS